MKYLETTDLCIGHSTKIAPPLNFSLHSGEVIQIKGANGSGKSTLLQTLMGELCAVSGTLYWTVSKKEISYLPQLGVSSHYFNFTLGEILDIYDVAPEIKQYLRKGLIDQLWVNSSGGERQLTLILTRILRTTKILILDEPLNHLDSSSVLLLESLIADLMKKRRELSIIFVSHLEINLSKKEVCL